jgi:hypothetical protein
LSYDTKSEFFEELFKIKGCPVGGIINLLDESVDELILGVESKSVCSEEDLPHVSSPLARIGIEGEESMKFRNMISGKDWIFSTNVLRQHGLELFLLDFLLGHDKS